MVIIIYLMSIKKICNLKLLHNISTSKWFVKLDVVVKFSDLYVFNDYEIVKIHQ